MQTTNKQRWLYSIANLGNVIPYQAVGAVILYFYTDVKHLPAGWAAIIMTIYSIYNAINNPILGHISDHTKTRWGRRIPYIMFGMLPNVIAFALLFFAPFDGRENPVGLAVYFAIGLILWEGLATAVSTGYYSLLPEMFRSYDERTDVAARMNIVQTVGLLIGAALPTALAGWLGWGPMGLIFAIIAAGAMYIGLPGMVEKSIDPDEETLPIWPSIKATFVNPSFITVVLAQTMRFFATNTLATGMVFYMKYSLGLDTGMTSIVLAITFISAGIAMYPWRELIAKRYSARTTLIIAYAMMAVAVIPFLFVKSLPGVIIATVFVGIALAGLIFMGDVILSEVIDEDEVKTGKRRAGMYFGTNSLITTLSSTLVAIVFGIMLPAYGYNTLLDVQPLSVGTGFRVFMTIPSIIGSLLAVVALWFYPLHGQRLAEVKAALQAKARAEE